MLHRTGLAAFLAIFALLTAAHAAPGKDPLAGIHSVGIISAVGHTAALKNIGFTVFNNTDDTANIDSLGIDDHMIQQAKAALPAGLDVKDVSYSREDFSKRDTGWLGPQQVPVEKLVAARGDPEGMDAYIAILPATIQDPIWQTNQFFYGIGLCRKPTISQAAVIAVAFYEIVLMDAHTGKILASSLARMQDFSFFHSNQVFVDVPESLWSADAAGFTDERKAMLRDALLPLLDQSLAWTMNSMGIANPARPPADAGSR